MGFISEARGDIMSEPCDAATSPCINPQGIDSTRVAGKILAHMALARPSELLNLSMVRRPPFPYPPEPIRSWAVEAVTGALRRVDAGQKPGLLLRFLDVLGIGFSS